MVASAVLPSISSHHACGREGKSTFEVRSCSLGPCTHQRECSTGAEAFLEQVSLAVNVPLLAVEDFLLLSLDGLRWRRPASCLQMRWFGRLAPPRPAKRVLVCLFLESCPSSSHDSRYSCVWTRVQNLCPQICEFQPFDILSVNDVWVLIPDRTEQNKTVEVPCVLLVSQQNRE